MFGEDSETFADLMSHSIEIESVLAELDLPHHELQTFTNALIGYKYIDDIQQLTCRNTVRWINISNTNTAEEGLHAASIIQTISFVDDTFIVKNALMRTYRIHFAQNLVFKKIK